MTTRTARRITAVAVLRAIERHGPIRLSALAARLVQETEADGREEWEVRDDIAGGFFALRRGGFVRISRLAGEDEFWGTTAKGRALLGDRRDKGRTS